MFLYNTLPAGSGLYVFLFIRFLMQCFCPLHNQVWRGNKPSHLTNLSFCNTGESDWKKNDDHTSNCILLNLPYFDPSFVGCTVDPLIDFSATIDRLQCNHSWGIYKAELPIFAVAQLLSIIGNWLVNPNIGAHKRMRPAYILGSHSYQILLGGVGGWPLQLYIFYI